jgi:serine acetyltransferase
MVLKKGRSMPLTDKDSVFELRQKINEFKNSNEPVFSFGIETSLEDRIETIYSIIFPGFSKYKFYLNFTLARWAEKIDYSPVKVFIYRVTGMKIGKGVFISADVILDPHFPEFVTIGDYAILGWGAKLFTHEYYGNTYRMGKISIGRGAQVGAYSVVRGGVKIGEMAETSPYSVIYKDVQDGQRFFDNQNIKKHIRSHSYSNGK